ncbi:MAG: hypothetical protein EOM66_06590 [Clostridia bacterium]|nr:hypothetical protein [Candidatus Pelethousia sp.]NCB31059.1 hypothetical protein [Clostridia bacterium]
MKRQVTLYNVIIPIWLLFIFPTIWPFMLAGNFGIDSLVLYIGMRRLGLEDKRAFYKKHIFKIWGCGFLGDLPGVLFMLLAVSLSDLIGAPNSAVYDFLYENLTSAVSFDPFSSIWSVLWITIAVAISAFCLYWLNYKLVYRRTELEDGQKKRLALMMAVITAPWFFYLPTKWFYF